MNWSSSIAQSDLLHVYDKHDVVESTLRAMGLDHTRVLVRCDPDYRHTAPSDDEASARAHAARTRAIMSGEHHHNWQQASLSTRQPSQHPSLQGYHSASLCSKCTDKNWVFSG